MADGAACAVTDLLSEARSGDPAAFAELVRRHQRAVYSLALRMLWDRHKAEDLAQDVFMQLYRKLAHMQSDAHVASWLRKVTTHLAIDRLRQEPGYELVPLEADPGIPAEPAGGDPLLQRRLRALLAQLPAPARAVLLLRYQEDLDPVEIASTLDMPVNTVKSHLKRSLSSLREQLGEGFETAAAPEGGPIP
ncbi:MAG: RNA polymerase sigma factor [Steroidobacteraceae bacterium]